MVTPENPILQPVRAEISCSARVVILSMLSCTASKSPKKSTRTLKTKIHNPFRARVAAFGSLHLLAGLSASSLGVSPEGCFSSQASSLQT